MNGTVVPQDQARTTVSAALDAGIQYFDTAPHYGDGRAEHRRILVDQLVDLVGEDIEAYGGAEDQLDLEGFQRVNERSDGRPFSRISGIERFELAMMRFGPSSDSTNKASEGRQCARNFSTNPGVSIGMNWWITP